MNSMLGILICPEEFHNEEEGREKLQNWGDSGLQLVLLKKGQEEETLEGLKAAGASLSEVLWIVTEEYQWELGKKRQIAMLPYAPGDTFAFPQAEYLITGLWEVEASYLKQVYCRCHDLPLVIAETPDFVLREFSMEDLDALFALYEDPTVYPFVEPLFSREEETIYEEKYIKNMYGLLGFGMWLVCDPLSQEVIGRAGLEVKDFTDPEGKTEGSRLEMGWLIRRDRRGQGLATAVCRAIIEFAAKELSYPEINCQIHDSNRASIRLAEKLGFRYAGPAEKGMSRYIYQL